MAHHRAPLTSSAFTAQFSRALAFALLVAACSLPPFHCPAFAVALRRADLSPAEPRAGPILISHAPPSETAFLVAHASVPQTQRQQLQQDAIYFSAAVEEGLLELHRQALAYDAGCRAQPWSVRRSSGCRRLRRSWEQGLESLLEDAARFSAAKRALEASRWRVQARLALRLQEREAAQRAERGVGEPVVEGLEFDGRELAFLADCAAESPSQPLLAGLDRDLERGRGRALEHRRRILARSGVEDSLGQAQALAGAAAEGRRAELGLAAVERCLRCLARAPARGSRASDVGLGEPAWPLRTASGTCGCSVRPGEAASLAVSLRR